jgi:hypothetical protein
LRKKSGNRTDINLVSSGFIAEKLVGVSGDGPRFTSYDAHWLLGNYKVEKGSSAWIDMVQRALQSREMPIL